MDEALFFIGGLVLGTVSSIAVARMQERHRIRVATLTEVLPALGYSTYAHNEEYAERSNELVTLAMVLTRSERTKAAAIFNIYQERLRLPPLPVAVNDPAASATLKQSHEDLTKRRAQAMVHLRVDLSKRLRMFGGLSDVEKEALNE